MSFLFKVETGPDIGIGHLKRIESIHNELLQLSKDSFISCDNNESVNELFLRNLIKSKEYDNFEKEIKGNSFIKHVVFDLSNKRYLDNPQKIENYCTFLNQKNIKYSIIDGLGDDRLSKKAYFENCLNYFLPYVGSEIVNLSNFKFNKFVGSKYSPFNRLNSEKYKYKYQVSNPRKILITCGGADPQNNTFDILNLIMKLNLIKVEIIVVIGPYFSKYLKNKLKNFDNFKNIKFVYNKKSIFNLYKWSELVITNTGTTRYECLSMNIPFIFFSYGIKKEYEPLKSFNNVLNQSYFGDFKYSKIDIKELKDLFHSKDKFRLLQKSTKDIVDQLGSKRIAEVLIT